MGVLHFALALCVVAEVPNCQPGDETTLLQGVVKHHHAPPLHSLARDAWTYFYPMLVMDATRGTKPSNTMLHKRTLANPSMDSVVKPNVDTLYSGLWFDVTGNNVLTLGVPDTDERFYLWQFMDMWSNTFHSLGSRTTGTTAQTFHLVGPDYSGELTGRSTTITAPTRSGFAITRILCNGAAEYRKVWALQKGFTASYSGGHTVSLLNTAPLPPPEFVDEMDTEAFWKKAIDLVVAGNIPREYDEQMISKLEQLGVFPVGAIPTNPFNWNDLPEQKQTILKEGATAAKQVLKNMPDPTAPSSVSGWSRSVESVGNFGTEYGLRAYFALTALGVNLPEDAFYPQISHGSDSNPLNSANDYTITFDQLPPVNAFWSLTAYGVDNYLIPNEPEVYALGDRSGLVEVDGKTTIYLSSNAPDDDKLANWLPTPEVNGAEDFSLTMRLYSPEPQVLDGTWTPPVVQLVPQ